MKTIVALVAALPMMSLALAQDVAMGGPPRQRENVSRRRTRWPSKRPTSSGPSAGGRPDSSAGRAHVGEGRTLVELAQRLSLDLTTVSIDPDWDVNKWTMAFGDDYGARAEKGDLKLVYSYWNAN